MTYNRDNLAVPIEELTEVVRQARVGEFKPDAPRGKRKMKVAERTAVSELEEELGLTRRELASALAGVDIEDSDLKEMGAFEPEEELHKLWRDYEEDQEGGQKFVELMGATPEARAKSTTGEELCSSTEDNASESEDSVNVDAGASEGEDAIAARCSSIQADVMGKRDLCRSTPKMANPEEIWTHSVRMTAHYGHCEDKAKLGCGKPKTAVYQMVDVDPDLYWPRCADCFPDLDK